jgi:hypothetical protein
MERYRIGTDAPNRLEIPVSEQVGARRIREDSPPSFLGTFVDIQSRSSGTG